MTSGTEATPIGIAGVLSRAARAWLQHPRLAALSLGSMLVQQLFKVGLAFSLKLIIDNVTSGHDKPPLDLIIVVLAAGFAASALATALGERVNARVGALIVNDVRRRLHGRLEQLSPGYFVATPLSSVLSRFGTNLKSLEVGYTQAFLNTALVAFTFAITLPLLYLLEWHLALLTCLSLPFLVVVTRRLIPASVEAYGRLRDTESRILGVVQETVQAAPLVKSFRLEAVRDAALGKVLGDWEERSIRSRVALGAVGKSAGLTVLLIQVVIVVVGAKLAERGSLSAGSLIAFIGVLGILTQNLYEYVKKDVPALVEAATGVARIEQTLDLLPSVVDAPGVPSLPRPEQAISFSEVTFSYPEERPTLTDVTFEIPVGTSVAFVGSSGSGKSTVLSLLLRFYDPQEGRITIDGHDLRQVTQSSLRAQLGAVFQDNFIFADTLRENIRIGRPSASDEEVIHAARLAELHDFVAALPESYDTYAGESGGRLSGGQRQRLAIARAVLNDPAVMLLDEATSALDPGTEAAVNATLVRLAAGRTTIAVTHRLAAATSADRIFVMDGGRIVEHGTHDALLAEQGIYRALWEKQSGFEVSLDGREGHVRAGWLRRLALFAELADETLEQVRQEFQPVYYEPGQIVFHQGDPGDRFYLIARGTVEVLVVDSGDEHLLETLEDGDHFGEIALLASAQRTASIRTITPCLFLTMSREQFLALVERTPEMRGPLDERIARSRQNLAAARPRSDVEP